MKEVCVILDKNGDAVGGRQALLFPDLLPKPVNHVDNTPLRLKVREKIQKIRSLGVGNNNAEKWNKESAHLLIIEALLLAFMDKNHCYIGKVFREMGVTENVATYLVKKFPELEDDYDSLKAICIANGTDLALRGVISPALWGLLLKLAEDRALKRGENTQQKLVIEMPEAVRNYLNEGNISLPGSSPVPSSDTLSGSSPVPSSDTLHASSPEPSSDPPPDSPL